MTASNSPFVSVVIPAFNRVDTIGAAVRSVLGQSHLNLEVLVVDDGSSDGTLSALDGISDPRLKTLANPRNLGPSAARNAGIRAARGEWVAFQDSDDEWMNDKLTKQLERIAHRGSNCVAAYCGMVTDIPVAGSKRSSELRYYPDASVGPREGDLVDALLCRSLISTQTLVARRDALNEIGGFDESLPALEDWDCALRLSRLGEIAFVEEPLVKQHISVNSITRNRAKWAFARDRIVEKNIEFLALRPEILAGHYRSIAGEYRRLGKPLEARNAIRKALGVTPRDPKLWLLMTYVTIQGILA